MPSKLPEGTGKRVPLNMRTTADLRAKLDAAAEQSGRSLAQEVEIRLERSFDLPQMLELAIQRTAAQSTVGIRELMASVEDGIVNFAGGDDLLMLWTQLAFAIRRVEYDTGHSIRDDEATRNAAERAVLSEVPSLFRGLPPKYSEFKREAAAQSKTPMLSELGKQLKQQDMSPLGGWDGYEIVPNRKEDKI